ncbi:MetS family NSS transporter small subunit [Clostridium sp. MB40-C1]|nr:MetS family NSS transporter small subunit [Clostridium sp. MB40-C1]WMJ79063.1 MetS family NSS transporter small subunit [Clostridium sp. MB40-C1]WMJ80019.1 MetS family NSS transporter small subunit [Clostridium sp. MB40-C1]
METSSIIMLICGITLLYGGLGFCITSAIKSEKRKKG